MEKKQLTQFTFYDLYWELIKQLKDDAAGRMATNICKFMFTEEDIPFPTDDKENYFWSNLIDILAEDKEIEQNGKTPKMLNNKMRHFTFLDTYYKAFKLITIEECGAYIKAICSYMFDGVEKTLKPSIAGYFALAKRKMELSRKRKKIGSIGGKSERVKLTDEQISERTNNGGYYLTYEEFMQLHPNIQNDLYASRQHLLKDVDWTWLDYGLDKHPEYKKCNSLYQILVHYNEIVRWSKD